MTFLGWDDAIRLAEAHNDRYRALIYVAVDSGMRWSELVGSGDATSTSRSARSGSPTSSCSSPTGPSSARSPRPPPVSARHHRPLHGGAPRGAPRPPTGAGPDDLVFPNAAGHPMTASSFLTNHFAKAKAAAGVSCRFRDLRHTSVALAIAAGAHPKAIQSRMGHSRSTSPSTATATCSRARRSHRHRLRVVPARSHPPLGSRPTRPRLTPEHALLDPLSTSPCRDVQPGGSVRRIMAPGRAAPRRPGAGVLGQWARAGGPDSAVGYPAAVGAKGGGPRMVMPRGFCVAEAWRRVRSTRSLVSSVAGSLALR